MTSEMGSEITLFIGNLSIGGAERVTVNLANQLAENGHDVEVLVVTDDGELADELVPAVEQSVLSVDRMRWAAIPLARHVRRTHPDALISFMTAANVMAIVAARMARVSTTVIVTEHSTKSEVQDITQKPDLVLAKYLYSFSDHIVGVSEGVSNDIRSWARIADNKVTTIYNPVISKKKVNKTYDPPAHSWFQNNNLEVILSVGRHAKEKDYPTLINAFSKISKERQDARLVLLGGGELTAEYRALCDNLGVSEKVSMPGFVRDPYPYMYHADVFVLSSKLEGLSLVLIEAMACGTPVVSTDCPNGPSEVLVGGEYGDLTPVGDSEALKDAIVKALLEPIQPEKLKQRACDFSISRATRQYESIITGDS